MRIIANDLVVFLREHIIGNFTAIASILAKK